MGAKDKPKTGGRKAGTQNKVNKTLLDMIEASGLDSPSQVLFNTMHNKETEPAVVLDCAKALLQYTEKKMPISQEISATIAPFAVKITSEDEKI